MNGESSLRLVRTYLQYGVPSDWAQNLAQAGVSVTTFRATSKENLQTKYGLPAEIVEQVKHLVCRQPIDEGVVETLLEKSSYTCCCCKGIKSKSYIIHHIVEYSETQDNDYSNLAVLCPACHDLAHRNPGLTSQLTPEQIRHSKERWEKEVEKHAAEVAARVGEIDDSDYINIPRILELSSSLAGELGMPADIATVTQELATIAEGIPSGQSLLDLGFSAFRPVLYTQKAFQTLLPFVRFENLDDLLNRRSLLRPDFIGTFCFYIGGLYGKNDRALTADAFPPSTVLWFRRKGFHCEWLVDPQFITSRTALIRFLDHSVYIVYGRIRSVGQVSHNGRQHIAIYMRPYLIGTPTKTISRKPAIAYIREAQEDQEMLDAFQLEDEESPIE